MKENLSIKSQKKYQRKIDNLRLYLKFLDKEIAKYQFKVLVIKGLAYSFYIPENSLRPTSDIDLWCDPKDFSRIVCLFYRLGFENIEGGSSDVGQRAVHLFNGQISFDLHQYLGLENSLTLNFKEVYEDAKNIEGIKFIRYPALEEQLLLLSHIYAYEPHSQSDKIERDLELLLSSTKLSPERLIKLAKKYRIEGKLSNLLEHSSLKDSLKSSLNNSSLGISIFKLLLKAKSPMLSNLSSELFLSPNLLFGLKVIIKSLRNRFSQKKGIISKEK